MGFVKIHEIGGYYGLSLSYQSQKVFLTDSELHQLNERIAKSNCQNFSVYARKVLLNPNMSFVTINTDTYDQLVFELRRIGNNINQIARAINQSRLISGTVTRIE